tara:strand:+ start:1245 stop:3887 length:2643 start_codon:yes stop_codon:yes gene_type:complete
MSWKKLVTSGSDASLGSLTVTDLTVSPVGFGSLSFTSSISQSSEGTQNFFPSWYFHTIDGVIAHSNTITSGYPDSGIRLGQFGNLTLKGGGGASETSGALIKLRKNNEIVYRVNSGESHFFKVGNSEIARITSAGVSASAITSSHISASEATIATLNVNGSATMTGSLSFNGVNFTETSIQTHTGSNTFGSLASDTHEFTGSVHVSNGIYGTLTGTSSFATNADTVDGVHAASFLRSDEADTASELITFNKGINVGGLSNGGIFGSNYNISGVNQLTIADPGEGIVFTGTTTVTLAAIDDSTDSIMNFKNASELRVNNSKVWTAANDGASSGLDADTVDGVHAGSFLRSDTADTGTGRITLTGGLKVSGDAGDAKDSQLILEGGSPQIKFSDTDSGKDDFWIHVNNDKFYVLTDRDNNDDWDGTYPLQLTNSDSTGQIYGNRILTVADEGSGNGLDADTLDGQEASAFLTAHPNISAAVDSTNSGNTFIQGITLDSNGHVTGLSTGSATTTISSVNAGLTISDNFLTIELDLAGVTANSTISNSVLTNDGDGTYTAEPSLSFSASTLTVGNGSTVGTVLANSFQGTNYGHTNDPDTKFAFTDDSFQWYAGGVQMLTGTTDELVVNAAGVDMNFRVESNNNANLLFVDGGNDRIGINTNTPGCRLELKGNGTAFNSSFKVLDAGNEIQLTRNNWNYITAGAYYGSNNASNTAGKLVLRTVDSSGTAKNAILLSENGEIFTPNIDNANGTHYVQYNSGTNELTYRTSTRKVKKNIAPATASLYNDVLNLSPSTFEWKNPKSTGTTLGLIAEEAAAINPLFASYGPNFEYDSKTGRIQRNESGSKVIADDTSVPINVDWEAITTALIGKVKSLEQRLSELENQ